MSEQRSPWFAFYPSDFLVGTARMTPEAVGGYMRLLCHLWETGPIPNDDSMLAMLSGLGLAWQQHGASILEKLSQNEQGDYFSSRLEKERQQREEIRQKRILAGQKGGRSKKGGKASAEASAEANAQANAQASASANDSANAEATTSTSTTTTTPTSTTKKGKAAPSDLPFDSEGFRQAWEDFEQHRREKRQKLTPTARKRALEKIAKLEEPAAITVIGYSLENGYSGLFPECLQEMNGKKGAPGAREPGTREPWKIRADIVSCQEAIERIRSKASMTDGASRLNKKGSAEVKPWREKIKRLEKELEAAL